MTKQRAAIVQAARESRLSAAQMQGAASSLSNLGSTCVDEFTAIIPPSQSSILAVGSVKPRAFAVGNTLAVRPTVKLCLSADHRVMDALPASDFLGRIIERLEKPSTLLDGTTEVRTASQPTNQASASSASKQLP